MSDTSFSPFQPPSSHRPDPSVDATALLTRLSAAQLEAARKVLQHLRPSGTRDDGALDPGGSAPAP